ncbi:MAG TPA: type 4b pilus protein PilO2 [Limnobacter sp.]|nr:type 4b pilus protein PilO2 [Limnobacter sp.]
MKDFSCVVSVVQGSGLIAGLQWQPLLASAWLKRNHEVRQNARLLDCERWVAYTAANAHVAGFEDYNPGNDLEERPRKQLSLACCLARAYGTQDTMVLWRIRHGERAGEVALVILENGLITLDVVRPEKQAFQIMEYYQRLRENTSPFHVASNDPTVWIADQTIENEEVFLAQHIRRTDALQAIPPNHALMLKLAVFTLLLVVAWFGYAHWEKQERIAATERAMAAKDQSEPYAKALAQSRERIGMTSAQVQALLEQVYAMPVLKAGWALQRIRCEIGECTFTWRSVGGYTQELLAAYAEDPTMVFQTGVKSDGVKVARKKFDTPALYPSAWRDLPALDARTTWLDQERQMWRRSPLEVTVDAEPKMWPPGFEQATRGDFVQRFAFSVSGELVLMEDFMRTYDEHVYWSDFELNIDPGAVGKWISLSGRGAFYAVR